jgi:hypothetical protein
MNRIDAAVILAPEHELDSVGNRVLVGDGEDELNLPNFFIVVGFKRIECGELLMPCRPSVNAIRDSRAVMESAVVYPETSGKLGPLDRRLREIVGQNGFLDEMNVGGDVEINAPDGRHRRLLLITIRKRNLYESIPLFP